MLTHPATLVLLVAGGGVIGVLLSLLGAGGSILLLPLLVSGARLPSQEAIPIALLAVSLLALVNLGPVLRRGDFAAGPALRLGLPALVGSWIGGRWVRAGWISEPVQLGVFAAAALLASWLLLRQPGRTAPAHASALATARGMGCRGDRRRLLLLSQGLLVGLLTGIAGVGGGFAIVPSLVLLAGLPMAQASGTSLLLIGLNALVALVALGHWPASSLPLLPPLMVGGAIGAAWAQRLSPRLSERRLREAFALLLVSSALLVGLEAWQRHHSGHDQANHQPLPQSPFPPAPRRFVGAGRDPGPSRWP